MDVTLLPAHEQARLIASRQLSARELLELIADRYGQLHPQLNAVVVERLDDALERADVADQAVLNGDELGVFHGVPVTVKDVIDWVGAPSTWGDPRHADYLPERNAVVVDRLVDQGAIVWGKTNVPLDLAEWQTFNEIYGRTNNPYALERTPGGSSGGSAVSVAVGYAGLEIGSDIGGSLRIPAHYCGVFSHKPSFGAVPATGHNYPLQAADIDLNVVGPMARSALDLEHAMRLLSDRVVLEEPRRTLGDFTVGVLFENPCGGEQDDTMTTALVNAVDQLRAAGVKVSNAANPVDYERSQQNYLVMNYAATSLVERGDRPDAVQRGGALSHRIWLQFANERQRIRNQWAQYFDQVDLLLCPAAASAAHPHQTDRPFNEQTFPVNGRPVSNQDQWIWAGMASGAYLPATVAPVGQTPDHLPVGIQIIAPFGHDLRSIRFAQLIEQTLGGFVPPSLVAG